MRLSRPKVSRAKAVAVTTRPLTDGSPIAKDNHPLALLLEAFFKAHGGKYKSAEWQKFLVNLEQEFKTKTTEMSQEHGVKGKFGFSAMAGCTRAAQLRVRGYEGEHSGSKQMTFLTGHLLEAVTIAAIRTIGIPVSDVQPRLSMGDFATSTADAIIEWQGEKMFLSVKTTGYKKSAKSQGKWELRGWPAVAVNGIYEENTSAWVQSQAEMGCDGTITKTIVIVVAKDTIDSMADHPVIEKIGSLVFYGEELTFDPLFFAYLHDTWSKEATNTKEKLATLGAKYFNAVHRQYVNINIADMDWQPNADLAGKWNPCRYCDVVEACKATHKGK